MSSYLAIFVLTFLFACNILSLIGYLGKGLQQVLVYYSTYLRLIFPFKVICKEYFTQYIMPVIDVQPIELIYTGGKPQDKKLQK